MNKGDEIEKDRPSSPNSVNSGFNSPKSLSPNSIPTSRSPLRSSVGSYNEEDDREAESILLLSCKYPAFGKVERHLWFFKQILNEQEESFGSPESHLMLQIKTQVPTRLYIEDINRVKSWIQEEGGNVEIISPKLAENVYKPRFPVAKSLFHFLFSTATEVTVIYSKYRIVISLDMSPSISSIDPTSGLVLLDHVRVTLEKCLLGLVQPIQFLTLSYLVPNMKHKKTID